MSVVDKESLIEEYQTTVCAERLIYLALELGAGQKTAFLMSLEGLRAHLDILPRNDLRAKRAFDALELWVESDSERSRNSAFAALSSCAGAGEEYAKKADARVSEERSEGWKNVNPEADNRRRAYRYYQAIEYLGPWIYRPDHQLSVAITSPSVNQAAEPMAACRAISSPCAGFHQSRAHAIRKKFPVERVLNGASP